MSFQWPRLYDIAPTITCSRFTKFSTSIRHESSLTHTRRHCGKLDVPAALAAFLEQGRPANGREMTGWFKDPANLILSLDAPPYGLAMFGLGALANRLKSAEQASRKGLYLHCPICQSFKNRIGGQELPNRLLVTDSQHRVSAARRMLCAGQCQR
jgi:hypothetical protein